VADIDAAWLGLLFGLIGIGATYGVIVKFLKGAGGGFR
jgi:hypothetical protein